MELAATSSSRWDPHALRRSPLARRLHCFLGGALAIMIAVSIPSVAAAKQHLRFHQRHNPPTHLEAHHRMRPRKPPHPGGRRLRRVAGLSNTNGTLSPSYSQAVLGDQPSVYYRMNEPGGTTAIDSSPGGNNGTYLPDAVLGIPGPLRSEVTTAVQAVSNQNDVVMTATAQELPSGSAPRTVEFWFKRQGGYGFQTFAYGSDFSISFRNAGGFADTDQVIISGNGTSVIVPIPNSDFFFYDQWNLFDIAYDGSQVFVYVNGQLQGSAPITMNTALTSGLVLGTTDATSEDASYADLAVYPSALSATSIDSHWTAGASPTSTECTATPTTAYANSVLSDSPDRYYRLDDQAASQIAYDSSRSCANAAYSFIDQPVQGPVVSDPSSPALSTWSNQSDIAMTANSDGLPSGSAPRTVEFWFKRYGGSGFQTFAYGSDFSISFRNAGGFADTDQVIISGNGTSVIVPIPNSDFFFYDQWNLFDIAYDGSQVFVYVNGQLQGSAPITMNTALTSGLVFGTTDASSEGASYAELAVYPSALSATRIASHWTAGASPTAKPCVAQPTSTYAAAVLADHPSEYYRLDDQVTSQVAYDSSRSCANAAYSFINQSTQGPVVSDPSSPAISTWSNQSDIAMTANSDGLPSGSAPRTVEFWFKRYGGSGFQTFAYGSDFSISFRNAGAPPYADQVIISGNGISVIVPTPNADFFLNDEWNLLDIAYDGSQVFVYVNGQLQGSAMLTMNTALSSGMVLGTTDASSEGASYAELAVYPTALSPDQIETHWSASGNWEACQNFSELAGCWQDLISVPGRVSNAFTNFITTNFAPGRNPDFIALTLTGANGYKAGVGASLSAIVTCSGDLFVDASAAATLGGGVPISAGGLTRALNVSAILAIGYVGAPGDGTGARTWAQVDYFVNGFTADASIGTLINGGMSFALNPQGNQQGQKAGVEYWKGVAVQEGVGVHFAKWILGPDDPSLLGSPGTGGSPNPSYADQPCGDITQTATWRAITQEFSAQTVTLGAPANTPVVAGSTVSVDGSGYAPNSTVTITLHTSPVYLGTAQTNGSGGFDALVTVPASTTLGAHTIVVDGSAMGSSTNLELDSSIQVTSGLVILNGLPDGRRGSDYSQVLPLIGGKPPYRWTHRGKLPRGLTLHSTTGVLSGVPKRAGTFTFAIRVADKSRPKYTATDTFSITIN